MAMGDPLLEPPFGEVFALVDGCLAVRRHAVAGSGPNAEMLDGK
ncbi:hypothetical protein [Nocardia sp. NPDC051463]